MRIRDWLKPGIKVKRWLAFGVLGVLLIAFGFTELVTHFLSFFILLGTLNYLAKVKIKLIHHN